MRRAHEFVAASGDTREAFRLYLEDTYEITVSNGMLYPYAFGIATGIIRQLLGEIENGK